MNLTKTCSKCGVLKPISEFHKHNNTKDGKHPYCRECNNEYNRNYYRKNKDKINKRNGEYKRKHKKEASAQNKIWYENGGREIQGKKSMYKNKSCAAYLGIVIGERLCKHLFKDVEMMPYGNTGYDIICNRGKKIDVKSSCTQLSDGKYRRWKFVVSNNAIADYFICVAFDNRTDLTPLHLWMIPGHEINTQGSISISPSTIHKWDEWKMDINDAQLCCAEMKNK